MKTLVKKIMIMAVVMLPLSMEAQDVSALVNLSNKYQELGTEIEELNTFIKQEEEKSYTLRLSWYNTCKAYLQKGQFKADELDLLIDKTIPGIDGNSLYNELLQAKKCLNTGKKYRYQDIPAPTRNTVVTASSESKSKGNNNKKEGDKSSNKKKKKKPSSNDSKEEPVVDNGADRKDKTTPKQEEPIVTDPNKDRNGEDKPSAPIVKTESDKDDKTTPVTTPVVSDSRSSNPLKEEQKKPDKGEMEEGTSKKTKNSDGSRG